MLVELDNAIVDVLRGRFPDVKIYAGEVKEGFKRPAFFTQIVPLSTGYTTTNFTTNRVMIVINYFGDGTQLDKLKMHDELQKAFGMTLKVGQRSFLIQNVRSQVIDEELQFSFDLDFLVGQEKTEEHELMQELNLDRSGY